MQRFKNKFALITGGTSGMGFATAEQFISEGGSVVITGRSEKTVSEAMKNLGNRAFGMICDAGNLKDVMNLQREVKNYTDSIDLVFANAGYGKFAPIEAVNDTFFDELFNTLVKGSFFTVQQMLPLMKEGSSVIFNTSIATEMSMPNFSVYSAAKSAVQSFIKSFATELTARGIRVNGISPGHIKTNIFNNTGLNPEQIDEAIQQIIPAIPFKRQGDPAEIARAVLFLASCDASYIHGAELRVDAGISVVGH
ncbi:MULTISPECIES: SDR family oxidoreductase [Chryseobacterium]|uniref:NAD(P)-dependent dehydrogenase (Short-subunit alcohol dehydrogenase family) n=1 Tax=Chryseobacterium camelliae TaxID=1265445 RepID=A0ABU0TEU8_9FLAO|nr:MULTISPECIES: SDR family oxidoreductase [Chryseobacterium]MDT3406613.1 NAD(P)-dependent dehydrogenase (short-subunit alcohol dehydrogenase family) [Pseudacidovorax intermedius]MDQ1095591.1 NAD(P)-dependent dehydrogenase (short-subunit alcohol dehydrogenase family) [Chryseobacterium camelliae]MDQ1099527.1 NAD(P)-dependent dehydrogenase (short-subunit alcohol dehydrogenase family) [Chryseobacterium sp. SORGH_AS_1048]MDR6086874.1 NAD(P)-dependent dehydrogenase (short-subunit alcohol dehydrogena